MLYDAVCHANLQSVIRYPYPIHIRGIVKNEIRIYLYLQKFTNIREYLSAVPYPRTSEADRRPDRIAISISCISVLTHDKSGPDFDNRYLRFGNYRVTTLQTMSNSLTILFPDGSQHSSTGLGMLSVTDTMPVLVLLSVVG